MIDWVQDHHHLLYWLAGASGVLLVGTLAAIPAVIVRLPHDFFSSEGQRRHREARLTAGETLALVVLRNVLGWMLIFAGMAMLVLPGQGLLTILAGVLLADFPGKHTLLCWIISREHVLRSANWLRRKFDREPLLVD